ncbi:hypothetical protein D3C72_2228680 [compost metagenome]
MGLGFEFAPAHLQIDLLVAEAQRLAALAKGLQAHAQDAGVEVHRGVGVGAGQDQMIQVIDHECLQASGEGCAAEPRFRLSTGPSP